VTEGCKEIWKELKDGVTEKRDAKEERQAGHSVFLLSAPKKREPAKSKRMGSGKRKSPWGRPILGVEEGPQ